MYACSCFERVILLPHFPFVVLSVLSFLLRILVFVLSRVVLLSLCVRCRFFFVGVLFVCCCLCVVVVVVVVTCVVCVCALV